MRLVELDPRWVVAGYRDAAGTPWHSHSQDIDAAHPGRSGMGITFECPVHRGVCRLGVMFANPSDGGPPSIDTPRHWQRIGDTFDTLTLSPSVDASANCKCGKLRHDPDGKRKPDELCSETGPEHTPCWHGNIVAGEIR